MRATTAILLLPLALMAGAALPASAQQNAEDHDITCEVDLNELTAADSAQIPPEFRNKSYLTPVDPALGDFATKKCTFSNPNQTIQIRCVRVVQGWANAPSFTTKTFVHPCMISGVPECGINQQFTADNQTFKISPNGDGTAAVLDLFCVRNKR
jgi:hypothetical protein